MRPGFTLTVLIALGACSAARADTDHHDLRVELGPEYDSNPDRSEHIANTRPTLTQAAPSPLARLVASGNWASTLGQAGLRPSERGGASRSAKSPSVILEHVGDSGHCSRRAPIPDPSPESGEGSENSARACDRHRILRFPSPDFGGRARDGGSRSERHTHFGRGTSLGPERKTCLHVRESRSVI